MISRTTQPETRVVLTKVLNTLEEKLSAINPIFHDMATGLDEQGLLNKPALKLGAVLTVESIEDSIVARAGFAVVLKEIEGRFPPETFDYIDLGAQT